MVTTLRTLIIFVILLITNSPTFAQSVQGKWYTADSWADNSTLYCKRDSTDGFSKVINIDSSETYTYNLVNEGRTKSFYIETLDSNFYFTYFFTYQTLVLTGKIDYKPIKPKTTEKSSLDIAVNEIEFPGGATGFKRWCEKYFDPDSKQVIRQLNLTDSLKIDLLINTDGKIDSIIYYGAVSKKFSKKITDMFSVLPFIMPANFNQKRRVCAMTIMLSLSHDKKRYYFEQIVEERY